MHFCTIIDLIVDNRQKVYKQDASSGILKLCAVGGPNLKGKVENVVAKPAQSYRIVKLMSYT